MIKNYSVLPFARLDYSLRVSFDTFGMRPYPILNVLIANFSPHNVVVEITFPVFIVVEK